MQETSTADALKHYDAACQALAEAVRLDEVKHIRDAAVAMAAYARQAKNRQAEADAVVLRLRATRRLDQLRQAQKDSVGLAKGGKPYQRNPTGVSNTPVATLGMQGIDKNLAKQARTLGALSDDAFEAVVADTRDKVARAVRNAVREVEIEQERAGYRARTEAGGTVDDLVALAASGYRAGVIYADVPSRFEVYSGKGKQRSPERYYDTMTVDELKAMGPVIQALAAEDCALLYWTSGPLAEQAHDIIRTWGFAYKTWAFIWIKTSPSSGAVELEQLTDSDLHWGLGSSSRANAEVVLLATRGAPRRLAADVHQVVIASAMAHSAKPEEVSRRIERLYPGPYLELFARKQRPNWRTWGNEIESDADDPFFIPPDCRRTREAVS